MIAPTEVHAWVRTKVRKSRFEHILRVASLAGTLAERWGVVKDQAVLAALLHDCARDTGVPELIKLAADYGIEISTIEENSPLLLHAPVGAELARQALGIEDRQILDAVRYHTTGRAGMTPLEKVLFIADYVEPARSFDGVDAVRTLLKSDLDAALRRAFDQMLKYVMLRGWLIHPRTVEARNDLYLQTGTA